MRMDVCYRSFAIYIEMEIPDTRAQNVDKYTEMFKAAFV